MLNMLIILCCFCFVFSCLKFYQLPTKQLDAIYLRNYLMLGYIELFMIIPRTDDLEFIIPIIIGTIISIIASIIIYRNTFKYLRFIRLFFFYLILFFV